MKPKGDAKGRDIVWKSKNMDLTQKKTQEVFKATQATAVLQAVAVQLVLQWLHHSFPVHCKQVFLQLL